jgi:hypothetical protein
VHRHAYVREFQRLWLRKTLDELVKQLTSNADIEVGRATTTLDRAVIEDLTRTTYKRLEAGLANGSWKALMPGRPILGIFCSSSYADLDVNRFKTSYLRVTANRSPSPFEEVEEIFSSFYGIG